MKTSPLAGKPVAPGMLINVPKLITAYYSDVPDAAVAAERVAFGTSGHRGTALERSFNEAHILAITQAVCFYRQSQGTDGPLFLGLDTHALSFPAYATALEVLAANRVEVMLAEGDEYTPTPVISHAILTYNRGRTTGLADGIVVTPSHNPPEDGGFKYNPTTGGPADAAATHWIEKCANELLAARLDGVMRLPFAHALRAATTHRKDYLSPYIADLENAVDLAAIREAGLHLGVDPLGGAGVHYWGRIAEHYRLNLTVVSEVVDPAFGFMTVDWDGRIRMDPSSPFAMQRLLGLKDDFDLAFACDPDHDRHGIVTRGEGLLPPNHDLGAAIQYLFQHRPNWSAAAAVGKTMVSSRLIDAITARLGRPLFEVPVGFKWFVPGLLVGRLGFAGEESAGSVFLRRDGTVWTTDKDGIIPCLLAAELTARTGRDPAALYSDLARDLGESSYARVDAPATAQQRALIADLAPAQVTETELAGEKIQSILNRAPGNDAPLGGLKVMAAGGWFAVRPSGTESIYKIYAESFHGTDHLQLIQQEARAIVNRVLAAAPSRPEVSAGSPES